MVFYRIFLLCLTGFVLNFAIHFGTILTYSLFLRKLGIAYMPYHYMSFILSSIIGIALFVKEVSGLKWLTILTLLMGFIYLSLPISLMCCEGVITFIIYLLTKLYFIYGIIFFFSFVNNILTVREIKKYIGILSATGFFGAILAGVVTKPLLSKYSMNHCFILTGLICILNLLPLFIIKATGIKETIKEKKTSLSFMEIININFVKLMIVFVMLSGIIRYFIDFEFSGVLSLHFKSDRELAVFYGNFNAISNISILISQLLVTGNLLQNISLSVSFKVISGIFLLFSLLCIVNPVFWLIVSFQFIFMLITRIMIDPCRRILVGAISSEVRSSVRLIAEGIFYALGVALTGVIIALLNLFSHSAIIFFIILLALSLMYYYCAGKLDMAYIEALLGNLKKKEKKTDSLTLSPDKSLFPSLETEEGKERILEALNKEGEASFLSDIIKLTGNLKKDRKLYDKIQEILKNNDETSIKVSSLEVLARWGDEECMKTIFPFISHKNPSVKSTAILAVMKLSGNVEDLREATVKLILMLKDRKEENRSLGLEILGELGLNCFIPAVWSFFNDPHMKVRASAVNVASKLRASSLMSEISDMFHREENKEIRDIIKRAMERIKDDTFEELTLLITGLNFEDKEKVMTNLIKMEDHSALELSLKALSLEKKSLSVKLVGVIGKYNDDKKTIDLLKNCFTEKSFSPESLIENILESKTMAGITFGVLEAISGEDINETIASVLSKVIDNTHKYDTDFMRMSFHMAGICSLGTDTALGVYESILSGEAHRRDLAIEVIETAVRHKGLKSSLLKLIPKGSVQ